MGHQTGPAGEVRSAGYQGGTGSRPQISPLVGKAETSRGSCALLSAQPTRAFDRAWTQGEVAAGVGSEYEPGAALASARQQFQNEKVSVSVDRGWPAAEHRREPQGRTPLSLLSRGERLSFPAHSPP
jgi:hypothetical protein